MKYRSEIDGLRALAVVPVILFHAGFELFSGGFVGVDVFFVISGYLITTILIEDIEHSRFRIASFYERRARRILPALFFVMLVCIPFAWFWMLPNQMKDFSRSLVAVSLFVSNIAFWKESGYFDTSAEEKPLLHTWSLAVEEQYYVLFPIFLFFAWRFGRKKVFWAIAVMAMGSLLLCEFGWRRDASANFYLAPTRAWELFAGSIAAFVVQKRGVRRSESLSLLGIAAIIFSIFAYDETTPFPSLYALVPVVGVVLLVLFAEKETMTARLLGAKVFVGIGLISYSAYLWHQPVFAFARIRLAGEPGYFLMLFLSALSIGLAFFSWRFIERPFRSRAGGFFGRSAIFYLSAFSISAMVFIGYWGLRTDGFEAQMLAYKFPAEVRSNVEQVVDAIDYDMGQNMASRGCNIWVRNTESIDQQVFEECQAKFGKALVILGDSHAMNLFNIVSYSKTYPFVIGVSQGGCRPHDNKPTCHYDNFENFAESYGHALELVVFHQSGSYFIKDKSGEVDSQAAFTGQFDSFSLDNIRMVMSYLEGLAMNFDLDVLWVGPFLEYRWVPEEVIYTENLKSVNPTSIDLFENLETAIDTSLGARGKIQYVPYNSLFYQPVTAFEDGCFLFRDTDHFSQCGERIIAERLSPLFFSVEPLD